MFNSSIREGVSPEVTLSEMLDAREQRAFFQQKLISTYNKPLLCFTMNIAGPIKNSALIRRVFKIGLSDIKLQLKKAKAKILFEEIWDKQTGNEAFIVADINALELKKLACEIETESPLGRLYDMDVIIPLNNGLISKVERSALNIPERCCLICNRPAKECSSRRIHSVNELSKKTNQIIETFLNESDSSMIAEFAARSLLYEVAVTPKPGLVDRANNGSHQDMNFFSFLNSSSALWPYFKKCALLGIEYIDKNNLNELFESIRKAGKTAENRMLHATDGINTHKGVIFTMGIICAAIGATKPIQRCDAGIILEKCAEITKGLVKSDYADITPENAFTSGQKFYIQYGITGVRGEVESGLPSVLNYGLPTLEKLIDMGLSEDYAGVITLMSIMANTTDTNLIARSDRQTQLDCMNRAKKLLSSDKLPSIDDIAEMDYDFIHKNLSPGGSADLLAVCWMLHFVIHEKLLQ